MSDLRVCTKCGVEKQISDFYKDKRVCNDCEKIRKHLCYLKNRERVLEQSRQYYKEHADAVKEYKKRWYRENPDKAQKHREYLREYSKMKERERREKLFQLYDEIKKPCAKCGENRLYLIEFHHIDPEEKSFTISQSRNLDSVREEAKKCVFLCANCHKEFHHFYGRHPENPKEALAEYLGGVQCREN